MKTTKDTLEIVRQMAEVFVRGADSEFDDLTLRVLAEGNIDTQHLVKS